jgi:hypothetical protein
MFALARRVAQIRFSVLAFLLACSHEPARSGSAPSRPGTTARADSPATGATSVAVSSQPSLVAPNLALNAAPTCLSTNDTQFPANELFPETITPIKGTDHLAHFRERAAAVATGASKGHVRIAVYGDSNMTMDFISGGLRRLLQTRYGDAGHGYVALARPWNWYRHIDVRHGLLEKHWRSIATSTAPILDRHYGHANIAAESGTPGAFAWVQTADDAAKLGTRVSDVDLYYLAQPFGGTFRVSIDGVEKEVISTLSEKAEARVVSYVLADGPHKIQAQVERGLVRLYGASFERREKASFVVDSLGVGALNYEQLTKVTAESRKPMLAHRAYDLVVFLLGTNMFSPEKTEGWLTDTFQAFREALPHASFLILGAPDMESKRPLRDETDPRIVALNDQLQTLAEKLHAGYWDTRAAMGGSGSMHRLARANAAEWDMIHFKEAGGLAMGELIGRSLWATLACR